MGFKQVREAALKDTRERISSATKPPHLSRPKQNGTPNDFCTGPPKFYSQIGWHIYEMCVPLFFCSLCAVPSS